MNTLRVRVPVISAAALALLLSGCGTSGDEPAGTAAAASPSVDASLATAAPNPAGPGRCRTGDLTVTVTPATGHRGEVLTFTNASAMPCTLEGFPGVRFVTGDESTPVGADFARDGDKTEKLTLEPGQSASSDLLLPDTGKADCEITETRGFEVYPPEETAAIFISSPHEACKEADKGVAKVRPLAV